MLFSAWIELVSGLGFGDWSLKFSKNKPKKLYNKFYDPKWAFYVMHQKRHHKPDMNSKSILLISIPPYQSLLEFLIILLIIEGCPDRLILPFTFKPYILLKNIFH